MDNKVYIIRCPGYDKARDRVEALLGMMGGIDRFAAPDESILLKVNLLRPADAQEAVSTHPAVVAAVAGMIRERGAKPVIADSPGAGYWYNLKTLDKIYRRCQMYQAAEEAGAEVNLDTSYETVSFSRGKLIKRFEIISPVLGADGIFNMCKLKTHSFMHMTGAVKNNFGVIPGLAKPGYHAKLKDTGRFAQMLLDLADLVSPRVSIMDAVVAMEGDGPSAGTPRRVGLLLGATNPLALDVVAGEIINLPRKRNPLLIEAEKRGLEPHHVSQVEVVGEDPSDLRMEDFKLPPTIFEGTGWGAHLVWWQRLLEPIVEDALTVKPRILREKCIACEACKDACPMKAISMADQQYASIDEKKCIRCYCCHEMCAEEAVILHRPWLNRLVKPW